MKIKLTTLLFVLGFGIFSLPFWFDFNCWISYIMWCLGGLAVTFVGYDAQASMLGMGEPGEDLLHEIWHSIKKKFGIFDAGGL